MDGRIYFYSFVLSPPGYIQASRALMIASIVFGTLGVVATLSGMQCSKIGGENYILKGRIAAIGGVFFLLQGNHAETCFQNVWQTFQGNNWSVALAGEIDHDMNAL